MCPEKDNTLGVRLGVRCVGTTERCNWWTTISLGWILQANTSTPLEPCITIPPRVNTQEHRVESTATSEDLA
jgi:hypothetical protein